MSILLSNDSIYFKITLDTIKYDGGSRGNPGITGSGAHLIISILTSISKSLLFTDATYNHITTYNDDNRDVGKSQKRTW